MTLDSSLYAFVSDLDSVDRVLDRIPVAGLTVAAAYRAACRPDRPLRVLLRPGHPDTASARDLSAKVTAVRPHAHAVDFYHYGLNTWPDLDRIVPRPGRLSRTTLTTSPARAPHAPREAAPPARAVCPKQN